MKILYYEWGTIGHKDVRECLVNLGHHVDAFICNIANDLKDDSFEEQLFHILKNNAYDFVMSFDFFPVISNACNLAGVKYVSWVWDSPLFRLFFKPIYNKCNYIFLFDKTIYNELKKLNVERIFYMPLAVNIERLDNIVLSNEEKEYYNDDISFVAGFYENNAYNQLSYLPDYLKGYFDGIMKAQMKIHGYNFIFEMLTEDILNELYKYLNMNIDNDFIWDKKNIVEDKLINPKITELERKHIINLLSRYFDTTVYTDSNTNGLSKRININGYIDYYTIMPKVFRGSKINLNITLRTIKSGIPLRVFDVLGAGGFLITNYQSDLSEYFEIGKDLVCYESEEDLVYKVDYYLKHEDERRMIAGNGYNKVKNNHSYVNKLQQIIQIVVQNE